jgi:hypothetical protein
MGFERFSKKAEEKKAERAATEPPNPTPTDFKKMMGEPTKAEPAKAEVKTATEVTIAAQNKRALSIGGGFKGNVLAMIAKQEEEAGGGAPFELFPTIAITGGNGGGQQVPTKATQSGYKDIASKLPQGKQVIEGVFMGVRAEAIAWPGDFDSRTDGEKPAMSCAIRLDDAENLGALLTGSENFQFCPREQKATKWYVAAGGPGSLRPVFQVLIWLPALQMPVVLQAAPLLKTFREMAGQISQFVDGDTGEISPLPIRFEVTSDIWYEKNLYHYWKASLWTDQAGKAAYSAYQGWAQGVVNDRPDVVQQVNDWCSGADKPMTDDAQGRLKWAANAVNPRKRG